MPPLASVMQLAKRTQDPRTEEGFNTIMCEIYDNQPAVDALHRGDSTPAGAPQG
jgi:hypothetical protein